MGWNLKLDKDLKLIVLTLSGETKGKDIFEASKARIKLVEKTGIIKFLIDAYEVDFDQRDIFKIFELVDTHYKKSEQSLKMKIAITKPKLDSMNELANFYETVSLNRGHTCKKFDKKEVAIKWLQAD